MIVLLALTPAARAWLGDDGVYSWSESGSVDPNAPAHTWIDVPTAPGAVRLDISDRDDATENLGMLASSTFRYYGRSYTADQIWVSTNGLLLFTIGGSYVDNYCCQGEVLPSSYVQYPAIMPFWDDLYPGSGGEIWVVDTGAEIVVSWVDVPFYGSGGAVNAQVALRPDGTFRISVDGQISIGNQTTIGHQRDALTANQVFLGETAPFPKTWLFVPDSVDDDGDGFSDVDDCDDTDATINPGALDTTCDGVVTDCSVTNAEDDYDGDGFKVCDGDCDDEYFNVNPGYVESCDGLDNDCNGQVDDGFTLEPWFIDDDWDGWGDENGPSVDACAPPYGYAQAGDCDDSDWSISPWESEDCGPIDRNCDGDPTADAWDQLSYYLDEDGDGFGVDPLLLACIVPPEAATEGSGDCDDAEPDAYPDAPEICDGIDNDCDGLIDEADPDVLASVYFPDLDGDGSGSAGATGIVYCTPPSGYVLDDTDCDDTDSTVHPNSIEACPDGVDNDCDGLVDDDDPDYSDQGVELWFDSDGDGVGTPATQLLACSSDVLLGYVSPAGGIDCDDTNATISPSEVEVCDGLDNDCDTQVDEGSISSPYYPDDDGDGFGDESAIPTLSCMPVPGAVTNGTDCDDDDATINPGATETCDGVDETCSGVIDGGLPTTTWYPDLDDDGYGDADSAGTASCMTLSGHVTDHTDCDDSEPDVNPGADEILDDGIDNDCDGLAEDTPVLDSDGDGIPDGRDPAPESDGDRPARAFPVPDYGCGGCASASGSAPWALLLLAPLLARRR
ncbi:MAG: putative metal-binding motif-containing protein [Myxococcota bacterium]